MKVDTSKLKKASSDISPECRLLIEEITKCRTRAENLEFLENIRVWVYGKCELYHWIEILDRFDKILEEAGRRVDGNECILFCDTSYSVEDIRLLLCVLNFTTLLIEHSFSRHLYNSIEHLTQLISSQNMDISLAVLNLLYMFSKRSNFIPRLPFIKKEVLLIKLLKIAERWGDPNYGLALIDCCIKNPKLEFLCQLFIDYIDDNGAITLLEIPDLMEVCKSISSSEIIKLIYEQLPNPSVAVKMQILHRVRLITGFSDRSIRLQFVQARLQAVSVLIYSNALQENSDRILYPGFGEELCELIDKEDNYLVDIRAAVLRTLTSMLHFDRNHNIPKPGSRLPKIIHYTGAERQGGILPLLVRDCISSLTGLGTISKYPISLATSLFSLLYHLASYEAGGQALVRSGMMQSLICVINWTGVDLEHITFVTRAVRVIDLITNMDFAKFHENNGLNAFIERLEKEINICRNEIEHVPMLTHSHAKINDSALYENSSLCPNETMQDVLTTVPASNQRHSSESNLLDGALVETHHDIIIESNIKISSDNNFKSELPTCNILNRNTLNSFYALSSRDINFKKNEPEYNRKTTCVTQRAALLKSMLNFLKKCIQDHAHYSGMRNLMESSLPCSLRHIISLAEYYGPSLFLLATDVITVHIFNEPSILSSLQDSGITSTMLKSLLQKGVPATREVLGSLPNIFSALCLNERGLIEFMSFEPFDKLLKVLISPDYLVAMRRRRSSDPLGDTATNLGNALDDLIKHHPYLRTDASEAIVRLLYELVRLGSDPNYICWRTNKDVNYSVSTSNSQVNIGPQDQNIRSSNTTSKGRKNENDSSEEEEDDDEEISSSQQRQNLSVEPPKTHILRNSLQERDAIPLIDYIINVMKFIEAILGNSSNAEHCRQLVLHGGLKPLLQLLSLPNLPVDSPVSLTAQAVANVCKSIINCTQETKVIDTALEQLAQITDELQPLIKHVNLPGGSVLLYELLTCPKLEDGFSNADYTPLLHNMSSVHGYVVMLVHICRNASAEMRSILLQRWGLNSLSGIQLLQNLVQLYISLVWESTVLLNFCSDEQVLQSSECWDKILNLSSKEDFLRDKISQCIYKRNHGISSKSKKTPEEQLRFIKSLLAASSRLGRALAELFGTLVKLSVGSPQSRQRRNNDFLSTFSNSKFPSSDAKKIARVLSSILVNGFRHEHFIPKHVPKLRLTFLICSVGFTGPMLFDDKRSCFHLMVSQFCEENGLHAFFDMFNWALSIGSKHINSKHSYENCRNVKTLLNYQDNDEVDFPEGTGEFLDAWLQLLEKMVNTRAILDSPYALAMTRQHQSSRIIHFEPVFYLTEVHQLAMLAIQRIWKRKPIQNYGVSMTETIMTILKHLIKSNTMLSERFQARMNETVIESKISQQNKKSQHIPGNETNVNADHLRILTDMGFFRQHVLDALHNTNTLEQATDYLLNHPEECCVTASRECDSTVFNASNSVCQMDIDGIAISSTSTSNFENSTMKEKEHVLEPNNKHAFIKLEQISKETFNIFCSDTLERTFAYMEILPETVNTGTDLLTIIYRRQNLSGKQKFVISLVKNLTDSMNNVFLNMNANQLFENNKLKDVVTGITAIKLNIRLKVLFILLDEMYSDVRKELCIALCKEQRLNLMIMLLNKTKLTLENQDATGIQPTTPCWLQSLVDLMDAIDNVSIILQRKANMRTVCSDVWKWYDTSTGKWNLYSDTNNTIIKNAFKSGERSIIINIGRQRYTINFNCMTQVSEASGSHRPVMPGLKITEAIAMYYRNSNQKVENILTQIIKSDYDLQNIRCPEIYLSLNSMLTLYNDGNCGGEIQKNNIGKEENRLHQSEEDTSKDRKTATTIKETNSKPTEKEQKIVLDEEPTGFAKYKTEVLMECIVYLLNLNLFLNFETKQSLLKLCARLTKDFQNAKIFVQLGGIQVLLKMNQSCALMEFPTYAIIIIRHVLEAPRVLQESIECILAARTNQSVPVGHRDLIYILTQVSSAVARDPHIFLAASMQILRGDYSTNPTLSIDDSKFPVKSKTLNNRKDGISSSLDNSEVISPGSSVAVKVIKDLLYAIVQPCCHYGGQQLKNTEANIKRYQLNSRTGPGLNDCLLSSSASIQPEEGYEPCCCSWHMPSSGHNHNKPVLTRATIIKILADAVRSYQSLVPRIIMEHLYIPSDSLLIEKQQSCLSFIIDNFLPIISSQQNAEVSIMSRVLITSLADCYNYTSVQNDVAKEIHEAIIRTLLLPESSEKHTRLQVLIGLLPLMVESPMLVNKIHVQRNNMYRTLLRQGIMTDLCKIAQYIDLSNSYTYPTFFSVLRPLEILLKLTVAPGALSAKRFLFGNSSQSGNPTINRRFYPRLTTRSSSAAVSGDNVLRDIIQNVLSDRHHGYDFIFNPEDFVIDSEESSNTAGVDDEVDENQQISPISSANTHSNGRPQLNFNRLLDDFMQNEHNFDNLRSNNHHSNSISVANGGITITDHHHNSSNNSESGNNDNGEGESDGASSSSETAAVTINNVMGDVSTSDTNDSDSNGSTENDDRNDEDDDENHGIEEGADDPSETDPYDETRQFIEVFNHIYDRGSSETASNFADIEADDEASEVGINGAGIPQSRNIEVNFQESIVSHEERELVQTPDVLSEQPAASFINRPAELSSNVQSNVQLGRNETILPTTTSASISPRISLIGANITNEDIDISSNISNERVLAVHSTIDNSSNNVITDNASPQLNLPSTNSHNTVSNIQRRDSTRRLIFLDQQYCAPMPSFSNPTEEGQLELFNQDALHWWLEEAKHLDFESQTNACLYVGHLLIPYLINELKEDHRIHKKDGQSNKAENIFSPPSRRSAIPVPIQQSSTSSVSNTTGFEEASNRMRHVVSETVDNYIQEISSQTLTGNITCRLDPQNINVTNHTLNESLERSSSNQTIHEHQGGNNTIVSERLFRDEDFVNEEDKEVEEEMTRTYLEDEELNPALNEDIENEIPSSLLQSISENVGQVALNSVLGNEVAEMHSVLDHHVSAINLNNANVDNTESTSFLIEECSSITSDLCVETPDTEITEASAALSNSTNIQEITPEERNVLGSLEIPDGVDPSFLAALPEEMREEVIQEHLRMQRVRQRAQQNATQLPNDSLLEVNPEFLAALPPNIQSEVLMQQRIEQQRQAAQTTNPEDPVDAALFFENLPDSLRQAILTDMDESQIGSLPPELAAEAQYLRSDWESRNSSRFNVHPTNALISPARGGYFTARLPSSSSSTQEARWQNSIWYDANGTPQTQHHHHTTIIHHHDTQLHGEPIALLLMEDENNLLDPDSLSTLLLFLFIEDSKMNFSRLHRIVRNLCYHVPTREWIIHALITIIQRINQEETSLNFNKSINPQWLKFQVDAFGFKSNVFIINEISQAYKSNNNCESFSKCCTLNINPQATQKIIRNCLDMLFVLAKHFPRSFIPFANIENKVSVEKSDTTSKNSGNLLPSNDAVNSFMRGKIGLAHNNVHFDEFPSTSKEATVTRIIQKTNISLINNTSVELQYNTNARSFWDVLLNLDMNTCYRSSNVRSFPIKTNPSWEWKKKNKNFLSFSNSPFTKLLEMLPYKDICRSPQLTDMLVKLLASLSIYLSKETDQFDAASNAENVQHDMSVDLKIKQKTDNIKHFQNENRKDTQNNLPKLKKSNRTIYSKSFPQLKLVVEVLTHQSSTSDGLEDVAKLINNLSLCSDVHNAIFLQYLKAAILGLAKEIQKSIQNLRYELRHVNFFTNKNSASASTSKNAQKNILQDRFTSKSVVISTQTNIKALFQLPEMKKLLSTSSAHPFFLRTLKIFIQVREINSNIILNSHSLNALTNKQSLSQIIGLDNLWNTLSVCLFELEESKDEYTVLLLQPVVEAFFLIYGSPKLKSKNNPHIRRSAEENNSSENQSAGNQILMEFETTNTNCLHNEKENEFSTGNTKNTNKNDEESKREAQIRYDRLKFISFAEKHRSILNQILRQSPVHLSDGPFAVLVDHTRILDFDVKRKYFQTELERIDEGVRREENTVSVRRVTVFEDSFRVLYRLGSEEWKNRFYVVFEDEEGQDAGGLLREWYVIISREIFNPMYALFCVSPGDRVTYMINPSSYANPNHLSYFKFVGRVIAKAIHDNKLLECYFTRSFYKHILGKQVKYTDMESQDYEFYKGLDYLMKNNVSTLGYELTFSTEVQEFGVTQVRDLLPNGRDIVVTEDNKFEYVQLVCQLKMSGSIRQQLDAFLEGFYDIIPKHLISIFNEQELELLISGLPDIDIEDLKINTEYHKYTAKSNQIQWFWRALRSFDQADRAKFLQFVTGTSKVPLQGFRSLEGMNGIQKLQIHRDDRSTDRLPCAHTCFNQLDLPMYKSYDKLRSCLLKAIHECSEGFGFA